VAIGHLAHQLCELLALGRGLDLIVVTYWRRL
jgi:hypothetical protein